MAHSARQALFAVYGAQMARGMRGTNAALVASDTPSSALKP
jgi:hypothetical protein